MDIAYLRSLFYWRWSWIFDTGTNLGGFHSNFLESSFRFRYRRQEIGQYWQLLHDLHFSGIYITRNVISIAGPLSPISITKQLLGTHLAALYGSP